MNKKLIIIGAGGHGKSCANVAISMNKWDVISFIDDNKVGTSVMGLQVIDTMESIEKYAHNHDFFVAIGDNSIRKNMIDYLNMKDCEVERLIDPASIIGRDVMIESGVVVMPLTIINCCSSIGKGTIVNSGVIIEHDCFIDEYVHLSPRVTLGGSVSIGSSSWIGMSASIINNITVGSKSILGAGSVLLKSIGDNVLFAGVPAEFKKLVNRSER